MRTAHIIIILALALLATRAESQVNPPPPPGTPTATVAAGTRYEAGWFRRFFLGDNYRDLWSTPITITVLDLSTTAGGLKPTEVGGGKQTKTLRLEASDGREFVFRPVDKDGLSTPEGFENTIVESVLRDQVSAHHPASALVADVLLTAAGVLHPSPILVVMPDDPRLGEFREAYAGRLGLFEVYPTAPERPAESVIAGKMIHDWTAGFAGAVEIIDSDSLPRLLDADPREQIDARAYLKARLMDMLINDYDRNMGNWKWARMEPDGVWQPSARDRDKAMIDYGAVPAMIGPVAPQLIRFQGEYPRMSGLTSKSIDLDRRLLSGLEESVYDSMAVYLVGRLTDSIIDSAVRAMPSEYHQRVPEAAANLKARREQMPDQAKRFYRLLAEVVNIHATDAADSATVTIVDERYTDIELRSGNGAPYYQRRFDEESTRQIRLYLHGGDDHALVRGGADPHMRIRVIGGNGNNELVNASHVKTGERELRFYDEGSVDDIPYGTEPTFDRRPWVRKEMGPTLPPGRDWGSGLSPAMKLDTEGDELGVIAALGVTRKSYGFGRHPYSNRIQMAGEYAFGVGRWRVLGDADKRWEQTHFHVMMNAHWSQIELLNFYGFGNDTPAVGSPMYFRAPNEQWMVFPALAYAVGPKSDIVAGPVFKHSTTDMTPGRFLADTRPYGSGEFSQAGFRVGLYKDSRIRAKDAYSGLLIDLSATAYPEALDVTSPFEVYALHTAAYYTFPIIKRPFLSLKAGAQEVRGDFPFHEAAFVGGKPSERNLARERYAGDRSFYGSAELRLPLFGFAYMLPFDIGAYVYGDGGRVYLDDVSPGGWHHSHGAGVWIGILNPMSGVGVDLGNEVGRNIVQAKIGFEF